MPKQTTHPCTFSDAIMLPAPLHPVNTAIRNTAQQHCIPAATGDPNVATPFQPLAVQPPQVVDFYEFYEGLQEGWDGPALLVFSDGRRIGARLDRNGLRPARFWRTSDDTIYVASEVGVLGDVISNASNVVAKGRLGPGQMVLADIVSGDFAGAWAGMESA